MKLRVGTFYVVEFRGYRMVRKYNGIRKPVTDLDGQIQQTPDKYKFLEEWKPLNQRRQANDQDN